jgi:NADH-quinone oxidoreductase subunit A
MLVATNNPDSAKMAPYECGMPPASDARHKFQISFFLVAILFLVFDCEILFLYPLVVSLYHISSFGFWVAMVFILLLTIGFVYELGKGALDYAKDSSSPTKNSPRAKAPTGTRSYSTSSDNSSGLTMNGRRKREKGNPKYTSEYKMNQSLTPFQVEVLIGLLLGDGCINAPVSKIGGHRLTIRHSMSQHDYLLHLHNLFEAFVVKPLYISSNFDKRTGQTYHWCNFHTLSFFCFASYRDLFYNEKGVKIIPANIGELLTPVGLAYWWVKSAKLCFVF